MRAEARLQSPRNAALLAALTIGLLPLAFWIGRAPAYLPVLAALGVILFFAAVLNAEAGLVILVASMLLSPELALGALGSGGLERSRDLILRGEDLILLLVGFAWLARMAMHKDLGAVRRTSLNTAIGLYVVCCLGSTLVGIDAGRVRPLVGLCYVAKHVEYFFIFFMTVNYVRRPEELRRLLVAVLATGAVITAYAYWQIPHGVRPSAPFEGPEGEPNTLGGYLVLMFAVAAAISLTSESPRIRRWLGAGAAALVPAIIATLSRSSWLAFAAAVFVLLLFSPRRLRLAAFVVLAAAVIALVMPRRVSERVEDTFASKEHDALRVGRVHLDPSSSARLTSWVAAWDGFMKHPLTGWGITGYGFLDAQYFRVLVELGAIGCASFLLLLSTCGWLFLDAYRRLQDPLQKGLALGLLAGLAALMTHAIGANTFLLIRIMEPFWLLAGLVVAATGFEAAPRPPVPGFTRAAESIA